MYKGLEVCGWHKCDKVPRGGDKVDEVVELERRSVKNRVGEERGSGRGREKLIK